jgi:hypothetical protein
MAPVNTPLKMIENPKVPFSLKIEKMRLSKEIDGLPSDLT